MYLKQTDFENGIKPEYLPFFATMINPSIPASMIEVAQAYVEAVNLISEYIHLRKVVRVFISATPFIMPIEPVKMICEIKDPAIHVTIENLVFIDALKIARYSYQMKVVTILEELAHAHMNIKCETLVKEVVAHIYPHVKYQEGQFVIAESSY